jgi:hypothetical protein
MIDWDTDTQPDPYADLDDRLKSTGEDGRQQDERIAIFAPKRCVETWTYHLLDDNRQVDETEDYSKERFLIGSKECRRAGEVFAVFTPTAQTIPSLRRGYQERCERIT